MSTNYNAEPTPDQAWYQEYDDCGMDPLEFFDGTIIQFKERFARIDSHSKVEDLIDAVEISPAEAYVLRTLSEDFSTAVEAITRSMALVQKAIAESSSDVGSKDADLTSAKGNAKNIHRMLCQVYYQWVRNLNAKQSEDVDLLGISKIADAYAQLNYQAEDYANQEEFFRSAEVRNDFRWVRNALWTWRCFPGIVSVMTPLMVLIAATEVDEGIATDFKPLSAGDAEFFRNWKSGRGHHGFRYWPSNAKYYAYHACSCWDACSSYIQAAVAHFLHRQTGDIQRMHEHTAILTFQPGLPMPASCAYWPDSMLAVLAGLSRREQYEYRRAILSLQPVFEDLERRSAMLKETEAEQNGEGEINHSTDENGPPRKQPESQSRRRDAEYSHNPEFTYVVFNSVPYKFTQNQAACVKVLWENWQHKRPERSPQSITEAAGIPDSKFTNVFRNGVKGTSRCHAAWKVMIVETDGHYRLAGDYWDCVARNPNNIF